MADLLGETVSRKPPTARNAPEGAPPRLDLEGYSAGAEPGQAVEGVRLSKNGKVAYVDDPKMLQERYVEARLRETGVTAGAEARLRAESEGVVAFWDPAAQRMYVSGKGAGRDGLITRASYLRHEHMHAAGGSELECWRAQAEYLHKNGYELALSSGTPPANRWRR